MSTLARPMNYRHAYHAGNFADVFKHVALMALLDALKAKPGAFCYLETHAGRGLYDLTGSEARKTLEADAGVLQVLAAARPPPVLSAYVEMVRNLNGGGALKWYPGSPLIAERRLRPQDRAIFCERQPGEAQALRHLVREQKAMQVHERDGYEALPALVPPHEKRGLCLIDPPFEARADEFRLVEKALDAAFARWPSGRYAVWYPIKLRAEVKPFQRWLQQRHHGRWLTAELMVHPDDNALRLNGCGLALINPPWRFDVVMNDVLTALRSVLAREEPLRSHLASG